MPAVPYTKLVTVQADAPAHYRARGHQDMIARPPALGLLARSANEGTQPAGSGKAFPTTTITSASENTMRTDITQDLDGVFATRNLGAIAPGAAKSGNTSPLVVAAPRPAGMFGLGALDLTSPKTLVTLGVIGLGIAYMLKRR